MITYMFELTPSEEGTVLRFRMDKIRNRKQVEQWHALRELWLADSQRTLQGLTKMLGDEMALRNAPKPDQPQRHDH